MLKLLSGGFRFGMLLQLAVGPMCLMVLGAAADGGFGLGLSVVVAIALIDAFYIFLSCAGAAAFIGRPKVTRAVKIAGCIVLILFGADTALGAFGLPLLPHIALFSADSASSLFMRGLILTASNPLTILFWGGVLSAKTAENAWNRKQLFFFGLGCVLSTLIFLTAVALAGSLVGGVLPIPVLKALNVGVGFLLMFFGVRPILNKTEEKT